MDGHASAEQSPQQIKQMRESSACLLLRVVPWPFTPTHLSLVMGWSMTPMTGTPLRSKAMRVPKTGLPAIRNTHHQDRLLVQCSIQCACTLTMPAYHVISFTRFRTLKTLQVQVQARLDMLAWHIA